MKKHHASRILTTALFSLLALSGAQAQLPDSHWQNVGTAPGGGALIIGTGTADMGTLAFFSTPANTSLPGNYVTLFAGSTATGFNGATVQFTTDGNTFVNHGIVIAPSFDPPVAIPFSNTAVAYYSSGTLTNQTQINTGTLAGGNGNSSEDIVGAGAGFLGEQGVANILVNNSGLISGGSLSEGFGENENEAFSLGDGVVIVDFNETGQDINGVSVINSGSIVSGSANSNAFSVQNGVAIIGGGNVKNITISNAKGGVFAGGSFGNEEEEPDTNGFFSGNGVVIAAGVLPAFSESEAGYNLDTVNFGNAGLITGGSGNYNGEFFVPFTGPNDAAYMNAPGNGVVMWGENGVSNISFINIGTIAGGSDNDAGFGNENAAFGSLVSNGVGIFDGNNDLFLEQPDASINNVSVYNNGNILGGNESENGLSVGSGYAIVGYGDVSGVSIFNGPQGFIRGGDLNLGTQGDEEPFNTPINSFTGVGVGISAGFDFNNFFNPYTVSNVSIVNYGTIQGGNFNHGGSESSIASGVGLMIAGNNGVSNVYIENHGAILGGNGNFDSFYTGQGIGIFDANSFGNRLEINGVTILNEGLIAGGDNNSNSEEGGPGNGGNGIDIDSEGVVRNVLIHNEENGVVRGGNGGPGTVLFGGEGSETYGPTSGGDAIFISGRNAEIPEIQVQPEFDGTFAQTGNIAIANCGYLIGGDAYVDDIGSGTKIATFPGYGIEAHADGVTVYNWGVIQGGHDGNGNFGTAILLDGANSTLNLNGHSSVLGKITSTDPNNVLNLNFTGVSPTVKAALYNSLAAQGVFSATPPSEYTFTLRGVNYVVDPFITHFNVTSYQELAITPNAKAVGASLDSITYNPTGDLLKLYNALDGGCGPNNPNSAFTTQALEQLSGEINPQAFTEIGFSVFNFTALEITTRLNNLRKGSESFNGEFSDNTALGGDDGTVTAGFDGKDGKTITADNTNNKRWGYFVRGGAVFGQFDGYNGVPDQHFTNAGIVAGVDGRVNDNWLVGALFNYSHTTATTDAVGSTARADSYGAGLYAGYKNGGWYANTLGTYDHHDYNTQRVISLLGTSALANPHGNQYGISADGGYDFKLSEHLDAGPIAGLQYVHVDVSGYNETGAGAANLAVASQSADSLRSRLGFHMVYHNRTFAKDIDFATELRAAWQHEFLDDSRTINSAFVGSGLAPFGIKTLAPERDAAVVGGGVNFTVRETATFYIDADVQVGQQHYMEESVRGGVKLSF